ncbi:MAG: diacylglycerol/polyprenol kinase family protein [Cyanobacteria bacterium P01_F01_bin.153]
MDSIHRNIVSGLGNMAAEAIAENLGTLPIWQGIILVAAWLGGLVLLSEVLYRRELASAEVGRKIVHIGTGNVVLFAWLLGIPAWMGILAAVLAGGVALISYRVSILPSVNGVGRKSLGTFFYAISVGVAIAIFWGVGEPYFAALGIGVMAWGDGLAGLAGQRWGRHQYEILGGRKSWEGSAVMGLVSGLVTAGVLWLAFGHFPQRWLIAGGVAIAAAALETISFVGIDNLTVPLGSAGLAYGLVHWLI